MKDFLARIGTFFFLIGIGLLLLFVASAASSDITAKSTDYSWLCGSVLLIAVGFLFRRSAAPPEAADRFRTVHKIRERREAAKKEKAKSQQQKK
jgi:hypothetical protein